jgi:hypothetical protein
LLPLIIDLAVLGVVIFFARKLHKSASKALYTTYLFFAIWSALGLVLVSQIIPLDMTVCETWFYTSMAGVLGMIGIVFTAFPVRIRPKWLLLVFGIALIGILGTRTLIRGLDWKNPYTLASKDIIASPEDYNADIEIATYLTQQGYLKPAKHAAENAVAIFPTADTYNALGTEQFLAGDYSAAHSSFYDGLHYSQASYIYDNLAALSLWYGNPVNNIEFINNTLSKFGNDGKLWLYIAILLQEQHDNKEAQIAINNASKLGDNDEYYYENIMNNSPITLPARPTL